MNDFEVTRNHELYERTNIGEMFRGNLKGTASFLVPQDYPVQQITDMRLWRITDNKASRFDIDHLVDVDNVKNPVYTTKDLEDGLYLPNDVIVHIIKNLSDEFIIGEEVEVPEHSRREISRITKIKCAEGGKWQEICQNLSNNNIKELRDISEKIGLPIKVNGKYLIKPVLCAQIGIYLEKQFIKKNIQTREYRDEEEQDPTPEEQLRELLINIPNFNYVEEYIMLDNVAINKIVQNINRDYNLNFKMEMKNNPLVNIFNLYYYLINQEYNDETINQILSSSYQKWAKEEVHYLAISENGNNFLIKQTPLDEVTIGILKSDLKGDYNTKQFIDLNLWLLSGDKLTDIPLNLHQLYVGSDILSESPDGLYTIDDITKEYIIIVSDGNDKRYLYVNGKKLDFHIHKDIIRDGIYNKNELDIVVVNDKSEVTKINGDIILAKTKRESVPGIYMYDDIVIE